ncbi:nudix hydrolase 3-like, partial [Trifolium medium]|nr:nudix hydrolase 3-like [Trifolium medium]
MAVGGLGPPVEVNTGAGSGVRISGVTCHHALVMYMHARTAGTRAREIASNSDKIIRWPKDPDASVLMVRYKENTVARSLALQKQLSRYAPVSLNVE